MWFRWEMDFARRWCPVVHHGERPATSRQDVDRLSPAVKVPDDCIGADGEPLFGRLQAQFPAPEDRD